VPKASDCNVPGCRALAKKKGVCLEHYNANYVLKCSVDGCMEEVFAKGRCQPHYMRLRRRKEGTHKMPLDAPVRQYGQERFDVFTRIPKEAADVILKASGRKDGMYEKAQEILVGWAAEHG
jgi:hypothetical protein